VSMPNVNVRNKVRPERVEVVEGVSELPAAASSDHPPNDNVNRDFGLRLL